MPNDVLNAKVVIVTGAARRVGAETARYLHTAGMNVGIHYHHSKNEALALCEEFNQIRPRSAMVYQANLAEISTHFELVDAVIDQWGRLDALVNNASKFYATAVGEVTEHQWDDLLNSNLKAPYFLVQAAMPYLKVHQGSIINITDIHTESPLRDYSVYCISKSGLVMMTKALAKELGPHAIRVNAVAPGAVAWPEGENNLSVDQKNKIISRTALKRVGTPADIAKTVLFLLQDAEYITGQVINVDGGKSI